MSAPVANRLRELVPTLRLTIATRLPEPWLAARYDGSFEYVDHAHDFGMVMVSATEVRVDESAAAYQALHDSWDAVVDDEARRLAEAGPDLVLANVSHITLAAAARVGIPAVALCSLNWAGIYRHFCGTRPEAARILDQMEAAYDSAQVFLRPLPAMPMPTIGTVRDIGPVARLGQDRRVEVRAMLSMADDTRLGLLAFGGIDPGLDMASWPRHEGWRWISGRDSEPDRPDVVTVASLGVPFVDLLRSCDLLVTKPGYGTFAEAGCAGVPVLYARRDDWPEEPHLSNWLTRHTRARGIEPKRMRAGDIGPELVDIMDLPNPSPAAPTGIDEAAAVLAAYL